MERPIFKPVGTPVAQLDTPVLVVDLSLLEKNIATLHTFFQGRAAKVRPYVTTHRCPAIAHKQLAAGGTVGGICVTTVSEAEVFVEHGFNDIFVANEVVTRPKITRLCALARQATVTVAVDNPSTVHLLSEIASAYHVTLQVVVDIQTQSDRCGIEPGPPALALARAVHAAPHLDFSGLMTYEGSMFMEDRDALAQASQQAIQQVLDTRQLIERHGLPVRVVSAGNTSNYDIVADMSGVTEVVAGAYVLMDAHYASSRPQFHAAAKVMTTVTSRPEANTVITDAGQKAVGIDRGLPVLASLSSATVAGLSAEHCRIHWQGEPDKGIGLGSQLWLTPWDIGICVNLYDYLHAVRDGRLEAVWRVAARGQYR